MPGRADVTLNLHIAGHDAILSASSDDEKMPDDGIFCLLVEFVM